MRASRVDGWTYLWIAWNAGALAQNIANDNLVMTAVTGFFLGLSVMRAVIESLGISPRRQRERP